MLLPRQALWHASSMRIDPSLLFTFRQLPAEAEWQTEKLLEARKASGCELASHLLARKSNSWQQHYFELLNEVLHIPPGWFFEHNGVTVGALGCWPLQYRVDKAAPLFHFLKEAWVSWFRRAYPEQLPPLTGDNQHGPAMVFVCHEGMVLSLQPELLYSVLQRMDRNGQTDASTLISLLLGGKSVGDYYRKPPWWRLGLPLPRLSDVVLERRSGLPREEASFWKVLRPMLPVASADFWQAVLPTSSTPHNTDAFRGPSRVQNWVASGPIPLYREQAVRAHPILLSLLIQDVWYPDNVEMARLASQPMRKGTQKTSPVDLLKWLTDRIDKGISFQSGLPQKLLDLSSPLAPSEHHQILAELKRGVQRLGKPVLAHHFPLEHLLDRWGSHQDFLGNTLAINIFDGPLTSLVWLVGVLETFDLPQTSGQWEAMERLFGHWKRSVSLHQTLQPTTTRIPSSLNTQSMILFRSQLRRYRTTLNGIMSPQGASTWIVSEAHQNAFFNALHSVPSWLTQAFFTPDWLGQPEHLGPDQLKQREFLKHVSFYVSTWNAKQWLRASEFIHLAHRRATRRCVEALAAAQPSPTHFNDPAWPSCLPAAFTHQGYAFKALLNPHILVEEGQDMHHCVAGFSHACANGYSRIYSVCHAHSEERATLEIRRTESGELVQGQLNGPYNSVVSPELAGAAEAFVEVARQWPDQQSWPQVELSPQWQRSITGAHVVEDEVFLDEIRQWMRSHHPSFFASAWPRQERPVNPQN